MMVRYSATPHAQLTVADLKSLLANYPDNAIIKTFDGDSGDMEDVTGLIFFPFETPIIELCTDEP